MAVIFDLDQTLIDSASIEHLRRPGKWEECFAKIPGLKSFDGIVELVADLATANVPLCVVTSSPEKYCLKVLAHLQIEITHKVCWQHTSRRKPHPAPFLLGLRHLALKADTVVAVGDDVKDAIAAKAAGIYSIGVPWGNYSSAELIESGCDVVCASTADLRQTIARRLSITL